MSIQQLPGLSKKIEVKGKPKEFKFIRLNNETYLTYYVSVDYGKMRTYQFLISNDGGSWKMIGEDLPAWIRKLGKLLYKAVEDEQG
jgi:hypothetical protein